MFFSEIHLVYLYLSDEMVVYHETSNNILQKLCFNCQDLQDETLRLLYKLSDSTYLMTRRPEAFFN